MHNKGFGRTDSEGFSAHPWPSRTLAAHARWRPATSSRLCEVLDRILAGARSGRTQSPPSARDRPAFAPDPGESRRSPSPSFDQTTLEGLTDDIRQFLKTKQSYGQHPAAPDKALLLRLK